MLVKSRSKECSLTTLRHPNLTLRREHNTYALLPPRITIPTCINTLLALSHPLSIHLTTLLFFSLSIVHQFCRPGVIHQIRTLILQKPWPLQHPLQGFPHKNQKRHKLAKYLEALSGHGRKERNKTNLPGISTFRFGSSHKNVVESVF